MCGKHIFVVMKNQIEIASGVKNSSRTSTLVHETLKNRQGLTMFGMNVAPISGVMVANTISKSWQNMIRVFLISFVIAAFAIVTLTSFNNSDNVKLLESISRSGMLTKFEYDSQYRIVKIIFYKFDGKTVHLERKFTYTGDDISISNTSDADTYMSTFSKRGNKIILGGNEHDYFELNSQNMVVKSVNSLGTYEYEYENGNLIKMNKKGVFSGTTKTFTYDDKKAPFYNCKTPQWYLMSLLSSNFDNEIGITNNVKTKTVIEDDEDAETETFVLEFYDDGFVKSVVNKWGAKWTFKYITK